MQSILNGGRDAPSPAGSEEVWAQIEPLLDEAMASLGETDRTVLALRYFENKSASEIGRALKVNEETTRKRANRALEKLRKFFVKRGVDSTAAAIGETISANSIQAAPAALAKTVTAVALAKGATASASTLTLIKGALKIMAWTKAKTAIVTGVAAILAAGLGTGLYVYHFSHSTTGGPISELQSALRIPKPVAGTWAYPSEKVSLAILNFGSNRASAFPILDKAVEGSDPEARKQAIAAMGMIDRPAPPQFYKQLGEPATNAVPFLKAILFADNDLSSSALASLDGLFAAKDIPALANLLVQSHNDKPLRKAMAAPISRLPGSLGGANEDQQLQRYIPEAIADTIQQDPEAAGPYISSVEHLLDDPNADIRFGAAGALAKYLGVDDSRISRELIAGLKIIYDTSAPVRTPRSNPEDGLKQLMAIETLQDIGPAAKPMIPALLEYAHSTQDKLMRQLAFSVAGQIDSNLRKTMPEVDQAMKNDLTLKNGSAPQ